MKSRASMLIPSPRPRAARGRISPRRPLRCPGTRRRPSRARRRWRGSSRLPLDVFQDELGPVVFEKLLPRFGGCVGRAVRRRGISRRHPDLALPCYAVGGPRQSGDDVAIPAAAGRDSLAPAAGAGAFLAYSVGVAAGHRFQSPPFSFTAPAAATASASRPKIAHERNHAIAAMRTNG